MGGVNAGVTREFITRTAKEFDDAAKEAAGVHQVLLDGYGAFKKAKDELQAIVDEAGKNGIAIDAPGTVTARHPLQDDVAARHDPRVSAGAPEAEQCHRGVAEACRAIVETCDDADESLRRALSGNVTDAHDFSAPAFASLADEEAARAADLAKKVTGPGGAARNVAELKQLQELMDDHRGDPGFSDVLLPAASARRARWSSTPGSPSTRRASARPARTAPRPSGASRTTWARCSASPPTPAPRATSTRAGPST